MKWSRILVSWTKSANSGCLKTSRLTVSFLGFLTIHWGFPFLSFSMAITPSGKHDLNFSWCSAGIGFRMIMWGRRRYEAVAVLVFVQRWIGQFYTPLSEGCLCSCWVVLKRIERDGKVMEGQMAFSGRKTTYRQGRIWRDPLRHLSGRNNVDPVSNVQCSVSS